ncbi:SMI1/KNR4 family protein [Streptomyces sp. NPDC000410]|uniref:SMI1/KNR4 family protein n=1 Tax=Streptomyces sp. NPDC000410 TaxID=3154254 RepID=UPI0033201F76
MNPHVERLAQHFPPLAAPERKNWHEVESALGAELPADYKQLVDTFGGGVFDNAVWVLEPGCANKYYDLLIENRGRREELEASGSHPEELEEEGSDVIAWALTENGQTLYWLVRPGQAPDSWLVMIHEGRGPAWERYPTSCAAFLESLLVTGEAESAFFHGLPADSHEFRATGHAELSGSAGGTA